LANLFVRGPKPAPIVMDFQKLALSGDSSETVQPKELQGTSVRVTRTGEPL
jgi:hypothetical protein